MNFQLPFCRILITFIDLLEIGFLGLLNSNKFWFSVTISHKILEKFPSNLIQNLQKRAKCQLFILIRTKYETFLIQFQLRYTNCLCSEGKISIHPRMKENFVEIHFIYQKISLFDRDDDPFWDCEKKIRVENIRSQCVPLIYGGNMNSLSVNDTLKMFSLFLKKFWWIFAHFNFSFFISLSSLSQNFSFSLSPLLHILPANLNISHLNSLLQYLIKHFATFHRTQNSKN